MTRGCHLAGLSPSAYNVQRGRRSLWQTIICTREAAMKPVVRQSKYRHLFGTPGQSDELYRGVRIGSGRPPR